MTKEKFIFVSEEEKVKHRLWVINNALASLAARVRASIDLINSGDKEAALAVLCMLKGILPVPKETEVMRIKREARGRKESENG